MTCCACSHAVRESQDADITAWLEARGLAFCRAYTRALKRKLLIPLNNEGGLVCGGRWFESDLQQGSLI